MYRWSAHVAIVSLSSLHRMGAEQWSTCTYGQLALFSIYVHCMQWHVLVTCIHGHYTEQHTRIRPLYSVGTCRLWLQCRKICCHALATVCMSTQMYKVMIGHTILYSIFHHFSSWMVLKCIYRLYTMGNVTLTETMVTIHYHASLSESCNILYVQCIHSTNLLERLPIIIR